MGASASALQTAPDENKKIWWIDGHGSDNKGNTFIVPKNTFIIVKALPSESTKTGDSGAYLNKIIKSLSLDSLQNPIDFLEDLYKTFGNFSIFKPGDICPDFKYRLLTCYDEVPRYDCCKTTSGLLDIQQLKKNRVSITNPYYFNTWYPKSYSHYVNYFSNMFKYSEIPTSHNIKEYFNTHKEAITNSPRYKKGSQMEKYNLFIEHIIRQFVDCSQTKLIDVLKKRQPTGTFNIFFNFVCRSRPDFLVDPHYFSNEQYKEELKKRKTSLFNYSPGKRQLIKNTIGEIEGHRKSVIRAVVEKNKTAFMKKETSTTAQTLFKELPDELFKELMKRITRSALVSHLTEIHKLVDKLVITTPAPALQPKLDQVLEKIMSLQGNKPSPDVAHLINKLLIAGTKKIDSSVYFDYLNSLSQMTEVNLTEQVYINKIKKASPPFLSKLSPEQIHTLVEHAIQYMNRYMLHVFVDFNIDISPYLDTAIKSGNSKIVQLMLDAGVQPTKSAVIKLSGSTRKASRYTKSRSTSRTKKSPTSNKTNNTTLKSNSLRPPEATRL
jgi:hypothetical protein